MSLIALTVLTHAAAVWIGAAAGAALHVWITASRRDARIECLVYDLGEAQRHRQQLYRLLGAAQDEVDRLKKELQAYAQAGHPLAVGGAGDA